MATPVKPTKIKRFHCTWYNIRKLAEDDYDKKFNEAYQNNKKDYFKKILHIGWWHTSRYDSDSYYGLEWANTWNHTHLVWETPKNLYWIIFRDSNFWKEKGKWHFKIQKTHNDHVGCG